MMNGTVLCKCIWNMEKKIFPWDTKFRSFMWNLTYQKPLKMSAAQSHSSSVKLILKSVLLGCRVKYCTSEYRFCPLPYFFPEGKNMVYCCWHNQFNKNHFWNNSIQHIFHSLFCFFLSNFNMGGYKHCLLNETFHLTLTFIRLILYFGFWHLQLEFA